MNTRETARLPQPIIWRCGEHLYEALTPREMEILRLVGDGLTNQDIADTLGIDERTTRTHVSNILVKTGTRNRTHLVRMAIEAGMILVNPPTDTKTLLTLANHYMRLAQQALEAGL